MAGLRCGQRVSSEHLCEVAPSAESTPRTRGQLTAMNREQAAAFPVMADALSRAERRADAMVHAIGVTCGLAACVALAVVAAPRADRVVVVTFAVYGAGLLAMLGCSAVCNTVEAGPLAEVWRRLDYAAIFVMIAGTYTPFAALAIGGV